jgi:hypothetical protein
MSQLDLETLYGTQVQNWLVVVTYVIMAKCSFWSFWHKDKAVGDVGRMIRKSRRESDFFFGSSAQLSVLSGLDDIVRRVGGLIRLKYSYSLGACTNVRVSAAVRTFSKGEWRTTNKLRWSLARRLVKGSTGEREKPRKRNMREGQMSSTFKQLTDDMRRARMRSMEVKVRVWAGSVQKVRQLELRLSNTKAVFCDGARRFLFLGRTGARKWNRKMIRFVAEQQ